MAKLASPRVSVTFTTLGRTAISRGSKGTVALIVRDEAKQAPFVLTQAAQIPATLDKETLEYIKRTFLGYVSSPKKVIVYVMAPAEAKPAAEGDDQAESALAAALDYMSTQVFDYLCGPADCTAAKAEQIAAWIKAQRDENGAKCKAGAAQLRGQPLRRCQLHRQRHDRRRHGLDCGGILLPDRGAAGGNAHEDLRHLRTPV